MQEINNLNKILSTIIEIDNRIISNQEVTLEDLKILTLINFNECLATNDQPNPLIKSYLTVTFDHIIQLENEIQDTNQQNSLIEQNSNIPIPIEQLNYENEIIKKMIHERAPKI